MNDKIFTKDWEKINETILNLNREEDILKAMNNFLLDVEKIIPYEKACIYFYDLSEPEIVKNYLGQGFTNKELKDYELYYCNIDDVVEKMKPNQEVVIRSSDAFDIEKRKETEYYRDYVVPAHTKISLDSNFRWDMSKKGYCIGSLDLFRSEKDLDFSEKEVEICRIFQPHLELKASNYAFLFENMAHRYALTNTEKDIATMVLKGYSNEEIAEMKYVTISTVKKHVSKILEKTDSRSRIEFICKASGNDR